MIFIIVNSAMRKRGVAKDEKKLKGKNPAKKRKTNQPIPPNEKKKYIHDYCYCCPLHNQTFWCLSSECEAENEEVIEDADPILQVMLGKVK